MEGGEDTGFPCLGTTTDAGKATSIFTKKLPDTKEVACRLAADLNKYEGGGGGGGGVPFSVTPKYSIYDHETRSKKYIVVVSHD
jgi:hypothetical protein